MFAHQQRPIGRDYCLTPSLREKQAGRASAPPKSPYMATFDPRCFGTGRAKEGHTRRDDFQKGIIPWTPQRKNPSRPGFRVPAQTTQRQKFLQAFPTFGAGLAAAFGPMNTQNRRGLMQTHPPAVRIATKQCAASLAP